MVEVPLKSPNGTIGVLYVTDDQERRVFNQRDAEVLSLLAAHAAIAITNSRTIVLSAVLTAVICTAIGAPR